MILLLTACFPSSTTVDTVTHGEETDTETATTPTELAEDDARVRALTDLPSGDNPVAEPELVRVIDASDGDTLWVEPDTGGEYFKVRMIGIDTPEVEHDDPAECFGDEAWDYTEASLVDRLAWLTFDGELYDGYDRKLAYVIRDDTEMGMFNRDLARNGYAYELAIYPNTSFEDEIADDVRDARDEDLGLWDACE